MLKPGIQRGELFTDVWQDVSFKTRQKETIFRLIGLEPSNKYQEQELEVYLILKAVRDYNFSKFAPKDLKAVEGIVMDVFIDSVPDLKTPTHDYANLQECLFNCFDDAGFDSSQSMMTKALQFYEILRSKHGVLIVGQCQSGKSTLIRMLEAALNKAALNELLLALQDRRKTKMEQLVKEFEKEEIARRVLEKETIDRQNSTGELPTAKIRKSKKNEKELTHRRKQQQYQELFDQTMPDAREMEEIRDQLSIKGVIVRRLNPKAITQEEMFGVYDSLSNEYKEGILAHEFRILSRILGSEKKWLHLDGPIDHYWVENLNTVLDDSQRMSLPSGEQIFMPQDMALLLETDNMQNITPATVSRCGLICLEPEQACDTKSIFNHWLR